MNADPVTEYLEIVASGVPVEQARAVMVQRAERERAAQPIPFHADRFVGIQSAGSPSSSVLLRESDGVPAIACRAIADRVASLDLEVVVERTVKSGTTEEEVLDDHPLAQLLDAPSPTHTASQTLRLIAQYLVTVGEAYLLKVGTGRIPEALFVMLPDRVEPIADRGIISGYRVTSGTGAQTELMAREVVRIWNPDPATLYTARGVLGPQGVAADTLKFQTQHLRSHYETNATPPVVIEGQQGATAPSDPARTLFDAKWLESYHRRYGTKRGLPAWIPPGWAAKILEAHGGDKDLPLTMAFFRDLMFMAYGVPRSVVGDVVDANRAAADTNQYVFDRHTIKPITDMIADALTSQLATDYPQVQGVKLRVRFEEFVTADQDYELRREDQDLRLKVRSINQVREDRGDDPVDWGDLPVGSFADTPYTGAEPTPPTMATPPGAPADLVGSAAPQKAQDQAPPPQVEAPKPMATKTPRSRSRLEVQRAEWARVLDRERRWVPTFTARMQRVFAIQRDDILRRLTSRGSARISIRDLFDPSAWSRLFHLQVETVRKSAFLASARDAIEQTNPSAHFVFTDAVQSQLARDAERFAEYVNQTTARHLSDQLVEATAQGEGVDEIAKRVRGVMGVRRKQAVMIARTEMAAATQAAQVEGFRQSGVVERQTWNTSLDDAVRDSHQIDGQVTTVDGAFELADGVTARFPSDPLLPPEDRINCRCYLTPVVE